MFAVACPSMSKGSSSGVVILRLLAHRSRPDSSCERARQAAQQRRDRWAVGVTLLLFAASCRRGGSDVTQPALRPATWQVPAPTLAGAGTGTSSCHEVGSTRACWTAHGRCAAGCVVDRTLPPEPPPASGTRCYATAAGTFHCEPRSLRSAPFKCEDAQCLQPWVALPDPGEWQCIADQGALRCRRVAAAAGLPETGFEPTFICGSRRVGRAEPICVDLAPGLPPIPTAAGVTCHVQYARGHLQRLCKPSNNTRYLGALCEHDADCPQGSACRDQRCLPPHPHPNCWHDDDCPKTERCRFGSCSL